MTLTQRTGWYDEGNLTAALIMLESPAEYPPVMLEWAQRVVERLAKAGRLAAGPNATAGDFGAAIGPLFAKQTA